jgi:ubiquinone/menaquinone biosynthesis C-methylase UbiE
MAQSAPEQLKGQVRDFWNQQSCGTDASLAPKFSREYFEEIEAFRYMDQPFIHSFAQFTRYHGRKVLEVGFGSGTDFIQWLRAGAKASGIDLTQEGLANLSHRIQVYGLPPPDSVQVGDAENLPFADNTFDLGYSFGVLHHSPNTKKAISELVRVVRPGGEIKIMVYNLRSIRVFKTWLEFAALRGKPWKSPAWAIWHHMESAGTKAYTRKELDRIFTALPVERIRVETELTSADYLALSAFKPVNLLIRALIRMAGHRPSWKLTDFRFGPGEKLPCDSERKERVEFSGNRLGFYHCISAVKLDPKTG